jgi:hypothetical protein
MQVMENNVILYIRYQSHGIILIEGDRHKGRLDKAANQEAS